MIKKKEFNGQFKYKVKDNITKKDILQPKNSVRKEVPNKLKVNLSSSLKYISNKKKNQKKNKNINNYFYTQIITKNIQKYNSNSDKKNIMLINNLIKCKPSHFLAVFKDYLITDYIEEFLRRIYFLNESIERIPKLYNYYKNYLTFFCKPTFIDSFSNDIIKNYGDLNAEFFYKNNLEKKRSHYEDKRILDKKIIEKDFYKNNKKNNNEDLIKTVFTKSIKNSIDNINEEDSISNNTKLKNENNIFIGEFSNKIQQDNLAAKVWGNDNENLISEENSLLLIINEIKDIKNKNCQRITEKTIKMYNNMPISNNNSNRFIDVESAYKTLNTDKNNNKENKFNILKANTYTKNNNLVSIRNMVYSPKAKKNIGFSIKKDKDKDKTNIDKNEKYLSPKNINSKLNNINDSNNKNLNSIVVNINININTNQNNNNNNANNNIKSPIHNINKKRFPLSPLSPINLKLLNEHKKETPFSEIRNKEYKEIDKKKEENKEKEENFNYIKIIKKKNEYSNLLLSNKRNKKIVEINKIKTINSIEENLFNNQQNYSCNKEMFIYNKEKENKELDDKNNSNINKNVYFSPKKMGYKQKPNNSMKDLESTNEINNKKYIYHKKQNYTIYSPLNKKSFVDKKYLSYKKFELNNNDLNNI